MAELTSLIKELKARQRERKREGRPYVLPHIHDDLIGKQGSEKGKTERHDCTVKAIANACDVSYDTAWASLDKAGREPRHGFRLCLFLMDDIFNPLCRATHDLKIKTEEVELKYKPFNIGPKTTIRKFLRSHRKGIYIAAVGHHCFCVKDGIIYDQVVNRPNQWIKYAFKITKVQ